MKITRQLQMDFYAFNAEVQRARDEYAENPTACADWCRDCVFPLGTTRDCDRCKAVRRSRRWRAWRKREAMRDA